MNDLQKGMYIIQFFNFNGAENYKIHNALKYICDSLKSDKGFYFLEEHLVKHLDIDKTGPLYYFFKSQKFSRRTSFYKK